MKTSVNVEFVISGDTFDLSKITEMLAIEPSDQWSKGDKVANRNVIRDHTCWSLEVGREESFDINNQLTKIAKILNARRIALKELRKIFELDYLILVIIYVEESITPMLTIKKPIIELMNDIQSELDIDMYL